MVQTAEERKEEKEKLFKFILEKCDTADKPLILKSLVDEFVVNERPTTPARTLEAFVSSHKATELFGMECTETKIRRMFALGLTIHRLLLAKLKKHGKVKLDERRRITSYEAYDRALILSGDHCPRKKQQETMAERRRSQMAAAENEEEEEVDDEDRLDMALDPELVPPPAPKRPRVEDPEHQEDFKQEHVEPGNFPGPGLEDVKQEGPEQVMDYFQVKIEDPEATATNHEMLADSVAAPNLAGGQLSASTGENTAPNLSEEQPAPSMENVVKTQKPENSLAPNLFTSRQSRCAAPTRNPPASLPAAPEFSPATQQPSATCVANNLAAPGASSAVGAQNSSLAIPALSISSPATCPPGPKASDSQNLSREQIVPTLINAVPAEKPDNSVASNFNAPCTAPVLEARNSLPAQTATPGPCPKNQESSQQQEQQLQTNEGPMKPMLTIATQLEILKSLVAIIGIMDLPMDPSKIKQKIRKIAPKDGAEKLKDVEIADVRKTIDYAVVVAKMNRRSEGETRSLKEFLKLVLFTMVKDQFEQIEKELKEKLETLKTKDMLVPVANITDAMEAIMKILVSN